MLLLRSSFSRLTLAFTLMNGVAALPALSAQAPAAPVAPAVVPSPNLAGIAHVALRVHDLAASVAFYEKLGYVKAFALSKDGKEYEAFIKLNDRQFIELYPATEKDTQIGFLHVCFEGENLQAAHDFYVSKGLTPNQVRTAGAGNLLFTMPGPLTPTGPQNMEYTQYMPGSLHSKDIGQHLGPHRVSTRLVSATIASNDPVAARAFYIDKAGFTGVSKTALAIPGSTQLIDIAPADQLKTRSHVVLEVDSLPATEALVKQQLIPYIMTPQAVLISDPDANEIVLQVKSAGK